jgi:excisionase family DNA binding protein
MSAQALLTTPEVAELLRVSRRSIFRWAQDGTLRPIRVGRTLRFAAGDINALIGRANDERPTSGSDARNLARVGGAGERDG